MRVHFPSRLDGLIREIDRHLYSRPGYAIDKLRELLRQCDSGTRSSDEHYCYIYTQLGFAFLLLSEFRMSKVFYELALRLQPDNVYALENIAHAVYKLGETQDGVEYGRRALKLKDDAAVKAGDPYALGRPHGGAVNLISFSLYGNSAKYCETAILNCQTARIHLPGFVCRFYVDTSVPADVLRRIVNESAEIVFPTEQTRRFPGTFWRFLALDDKNANVVLVRDVDAIVDARDAYCVREWVESGKPFHIIRDDCCHTELIHAGLFGAKAGVISNIEQRIATFINAEYNRPIGRYSDQLFLRNSVWPSVRNHSVTHDSVYSYGLDVRPTPAQSPGEQGIRNYFIGANYANYRFLVSTDGSFDEQGSHHLIIKGRDGEVVCQHAMERLTPTQLAVFLPRLYVERLEAGTWSYEVLFQAG